MKNKILLSVALFFLSGIPVSFSLTVSIDTVQGVFCPGGQKVLNAYASGGTPPYSYSWSTSAVTSSITVNLPGVYTVTVTDAASTTATTSVNVAYNDNNGNFLILNTFWQFSWQDTCPSYAWTGLVDFLCFVCDFNDINMTWNSIPSSTSIYGVEPGNYTAVLTSGGCVSNPYPITMYAPFNHFTNVVYNTSPSCINVPSGSVAITSMTNTLPLPLIGGSVFVGEFILRSPSLNFERRIDNNNFAFVDWYANFTGPLIINNLPATNDYELYITYVYGGECLRPEFLMLSNISVAQSPTTCGAIEGKAYIDNNSNCSFDTITDQNNNAAIIAFNSTYYASTDANGNYSINIPLGNYTLSRSTTYQVYTNCPATPYNINLSSPITISNIDFADTLDGTPDIAVYLTSGGPRVGFPFNYYVRVRNYGAFAANNITVSLNYDTTVSFFSGNFTPTVNTPGHIEWNIGSIAAFSWADFNALFQVPPNPLLTGYSLNANANVQPLAGEVNLTNNTSLASAVIVNSADPNAKDVMPRGSGPNGYITVNDSILKYTIHFQNTGTADAVNIRIIDTLSSYLNVTSFTPGAASHSYTYTISGNGIVTFYFNNINLPDSTSNEPASHGYVSFEMHTQPNLALGTVIENRAHNVFDFNAPVATNMTINTITSYVPPFVSLSNPTSVVCNGNCTNLSASGSGGLPPYTYSWIPNIGIGAGPHSVCPSSTTIYTVVITDANNVTSTNTTAVSVNQLPSPSITPSGPTTFCQGNSVTLTSGAASSYLWSNSSSTQNINVTSSGNYTVTVTDANNCTASSLSISVTVNPLPNASITPNGPTTICQGNSVMLTSSAASSYLWSNSSSTQSINVSSSGNYSVTVTDANNCSASTSLSVTVNPLPVASITPSGPTTFCQGDSVTLTSSVANNYLWSNSASTQSINVTSSGNYSVTVTDANNCSASTSLSVTVYPNPPMPAITQGGDSLISDLASGYQWYFNSVLIPGATSQFYHPLQNGNYSVVITDANNCTASSTDFIWVLTEAGNFSGGNEVLIYPNPAIEELHVISYTLFEKRDIEIYDAFGQLVLSQKPKAHNNQQVIDVSNLPHGIYLVELRSEKSILRGKFMKM